MANTPDVVRKAKRKGPDLHNTPAEAVYAAIEAGVFSHLRGSELWDPCDGLGGISDILEMRSISKVFRSDKHSYPGRYHALIDFLDVDPFTRDSRIPIVMNPPFNVNLEFIDQAHELADQVFVFNRLNLLETKERAARFVDKRWALAYVYVFAFRVSCSTGLEREESAKAVPYAWYVFDKEHVGEPVVRWITKRPEADFDPEF